jgi:cell division protein ZipA
MKPELDLDLPLLVDSTPKEDSIAEVPVVDEPDHNGLDAMLDDLAQATSIEELSRHGDIISDLNQVYDSLMPHTEIPAEAFNPVIDTTQLAAWEGESALINEHLAEHTRSEEDSILVQAEQIIAIHLLPKSGRPLEGRTVLRLLRKYGLRFGEMDLFHRFEETSGDGAMMFSVLKYTQEGPAGFDLDTMEQENFDGLSFFLALPGIKPLQGFDMMMSTAQRLGQECYAQLLDDEMNLLSEQLKGHYRHQVLDFRPAR